MGCGAVCGGTSSVVESSTEAQKYFKQLFKRMTPNHFLFSMQKFASFAKQLQLNPQRFQLILSNKLEPKSALPPGVMQKWKIILFGLDFDRKSYVNCLGYPQNVFSKKATNENKINNEDARPQSQQIIKSFNNKEILPHRCFSQIEKDLERTFDLPSLQKQTFALILRRISNHFPAMGYTQGINFIVGYLLIVGYSQMDAFWMFVHIALNRRYMLLGLFEDGFPLSAVYIIIFKNILSRVNKKLYEHLYEVVFVDESLWVFKWFITYYLYSFPLQMCQYVWDIVISVGGIGLVTFAVSLVCKLQKNLLLLEDPCEISEFFQNLKQIESFNELINIREVVKMAYAIQIQEDDLKGLQNLKTPQGASNFYAEYIFISYREKIIKKKAQKQAKESNNQLKENHDQLNLTDPVLFRQISISQSQQIISQWYQKLSRERKEFYIQNHIKAPGITSLHYISEANQNIKQKKQDRSNKDLKVLNGDSQIQYRNEVKAPEDQLDRYSNGFRQNFSNNNGSQKVRPSSRHSTAKRKPSGEKEDKWDDDEEQLQEKADTMNLEDDFFYLPPKDLRSKRRTGLQGYQQKYSDVHSQKSQKPKDKYRPAVRMDSNQINSRIQFSAVGHSVMTSSVSNASKSSISSAKQKQNQSGRYCNCKSLKNRTEQEQVPSKTIDNGKKQKKINHADSLEEMLNDSISRKRMNTYHDWMVASQVPQIKNNSAVKQPSQIGSDIQIYNGHQMFKKNNKKGKIGGGVGVISINNQRQQHSQCCQHQQSQDLNRLGLEQQSYDSIMIANSQKSSIISCQVQSVK